MWVIKRNDGFYYDPCHREQWHKKIGIYCLYNTFEQADLEIRLVQLRNCQPVEVVVKEKLSET